MTSVWIDYLRGRGGSAEARLKSLFLAGELATTEAVVMELLAGIGSNGDERRLRRMLATTPLLTVGGLDTWETAADISRACRDAGTTIASRLDCLIAAVAIREEVEVLHADRDFDAIAQHTPLRVAAV